jgi:hypothetical protein
MAVPLCIYPPVLGVAADHHSMRASAQVTAPGAATNMIHQTQKTEGEHMLAHAALLVQKQKLRVVNR